MRRVARLLLLTLLLALPWPTGAQDRRPARDPDLARFVAAWSGEGQVEGHDALVFAGFSWALADRFLALSFSRGSYEAQAYLRPAGGGRLEGTWLDSEGQVTAPEGRVDGSTLTLEWAHQVVGPERITWTLLDADRLELTTFERDGAAWRPTGRVVLTRP